MTPCPSCERVNRPTIVIDPGVQVGQPCIAGTRVPAHTVARQVWVGVRVDDVAAAYNLTRADVLVACWYYAASAYLSGRGGRKVEAWRRWAGDNVSTLAGHCGADPATCPDPPDERTP